VSTLDTSRRQLRFLMAFLLLAPALFGHPFAGYLHFHSHLGAAITAWGCDAMDVILPFTAALLVFPATRRRRFVGIALGVVALAALNLIRIATLYWLALKSTAAFEIARGEIFPVLMVTLAIVGFVAWARWGSRSERDVRSDAEHAGVELDVPSR
jgi:exosortase/archaeosortase family protein